MQRIFKVPSNAPALSSNGKNRPPSTTNFWIEDLWGTVSQRFGDKTAANDAKFLKMQRNRQSF